MITNMPSYVSTKTVSAAKIASIAIHNTGGYRVEYYDRDNRLAWVVVPWKWQDKHQAQPGWYLVQYKDGYLSASPAEPFEEASVRVEE